MKLLEDKKMLAILAVVVVIIIILGAALLIGGYVNCYGDATASAGNVTMKYNNDASGTYNVEYTDGSTGTAYYDEKTLVGSVEVDLSQVTWSESFEPSEGSNDVGHAQDSSIQEISEYINTGSEDFSQSADISFYDSRGSEIILINHGKGDFEYNMTLNGNILKIDIYEDYQKDHETTITNDANYNGVLSTTQSRVNEIQKAKLTLDFKKPDTFWYTIDVDLGDKFTLQHT